MQKGGERLSELLSRELVITATEIVIHRAEEKTQEAGCCALAHIKITQIMCQFFFLPPKYDNPKGRTGIKLLNLSIFLVFLKYVGVFFE